MDEKMEESVTRIMEVLDKCLELKIALSKRLHDEAIEQVHMNKLNIERDDPDHQTVTMTMRGSDDGDLAVRKPTEPHVGTERLDRIWKYLQGFLEVEPYAELRVWAETNFGYKYYGGTEKRPVDLRTAVCDKLRTFTELQIAELEK